MRQRLLPNGLLTLAIAAWALASPWASAARADAAQVTVVSPGGSAQTLSLDALGEGDVGARDYAVRSAEGESTLTLSGFSPAAILEAAGADPYGFSYLEVQRPAGGSVLLSRDQALDPTAFADGPAVVYATATGTGFLRPSAGAGDLNASDSFEAPQGVTIVLSKGQPLQVRARASTLRTRPGRPVTFTAIVERAGAGEQLSYSWSFDDAGPGARGSTATHRFAKRGSYDVVVGVTAPGNEAGASAVVTVQVGPPLAGPDRKGGGRNEDSAAPDHGAASGGSGDAGTPAGTAEATDGDPASNPAEPEQAKRSKPRPSPDGRQVSGLLLSSPTTPEPTPSVAARSGKLSEDDGSGPGLSAAALGLLATGALLGLGALTELRGGFVSLSGTKPTEGVLR